MGGTRLGGERSHEYLATCTSPRSRYSGLVHTGCTKTLFVRPGATAEDFERAKWASDRELGLLGTGRGSLDAQLSYVLITYRGDLERCLGIKGWRRVPSG